MKITKINFFVFFSFLVCAGQSNAQSERIRVEVDTDKGCKYVEFDTTDRVQIRKQLMASWSGRCEGGYINGIGTLTLKGIEEDTAEIKTTFKNGVEDGQGEVSAESPKGKSLFIGSWKDGMRTKGILEAYPQGASSFKYEGEFSDGKFNGYGKLTRDGAIYEGNHKNGIPDGKGKWIYQNGNSYEGEIKENKLTGKGVYKYSDGTVIDGNFLNGMADGFAKTIFNSGDTFEGLYANGKIAKGTYYFKSTGNLYDGEFVNGKFSGKGVLKYKSNGIDQGEFFEGFLSKGTRKYGDGGIYEGEFVLGKRQGKGILRFSNGDLYEGYFLEDKYSGAGKLIGKSNGLIAEGEFLNGELVKGKITFPNGQIDEGTYSNRKLNGKGKIISPNGVITEGNYVDGKLDGLATITLKNGQITTATYANGVVVNQNPPPSPPASPQQQSSASQNDSPLNFDDAKKKCLSIGFKEKSEQFGKCVLQLSK
jgi:hypothetical protein